MKIAIDSVDIRWIPRMQRFLVTPIWKNVDRPSTGGYYVRKPEVASRLANAMMDLAIWDRLEVRYTLPTGETFVSGMAKVSAKQMNADLKRLGY